VEGVSRPSKKASSPLVENVSEEEVVAAGEAGIDLSWERL